MSRLPAIALVSTATLGIATGVVLTIPDAVAGFAVEPALVASREPLTLSAREVAREPAPPPLPAFRPTRMPAPPPPPGPPVDLEDHDEDGFPERPSDMSYSEWMSRLPAGTRNTIRKHCRDNGGTFHVVCNGIGPLQIPMPPSLMPMPGGPTGGPTHDEWYAGLNTAQKRYYDRYCDGDEGRAFTDLCGATPLVISFDHQRVAFAAGEVTDWPTAVTPWLALDRDGDGAITHSAELFGGDTPMRDGSRPAHGFAALAELDTNGDGVIDAADPMFASLVLWADRDGDRTSSRGELEPASRTVVSISLAYRSEPACTARGNCERERASITWRDATGLHAGTIVDVYLAFR